MLSRSFCLIKEIIDINTYPRLVFIAQTKSRFKHLAMIQSDVGRFQLWSVVTLFGDSNFNFDSEPRWSYDLELELDCDRPMFSSIRIELEFIFAESSFSPFRLCIYHYASQA